MKKKSNKKMVTEKATVNCWVAAADVLAAVDEVQHLPFALVVRIVSDIRSLWS